MIRTVKENDLSAVMQIWLDTNIKAHSFISKYYWMDNYDMVNRRKTDNKKCLEKGDKREVENVY